MGKYLYLQCKRVARFLPGAICIILILMAGLLLAYTMMTSAMTESDDNQKVQVAICGDMDDPFLQMGMSAIMAFDNSRFSLDVQILEESEAVKALSDGLVAAYVVVPPGFMDAAMSGHLMPLKMVTTTGAAGLVSIFKDEVTAVITTIVLESQKGVFGMMDGFVKYEVEYQQKLVDELAFGYVGFILNRSEAYYLQELGIADELSFTTYLLCGLSVLLILLACLPFAPLMIRKDQALSRILSAKGKACWKQCLCNFAAYLLGLIAILVILMALAVTVLFVGAPHLLEDLQPGWIVVNALPVLLMAAALSYMLYSISTDLIGGVLLQFFVTAAMCFVSGCMYPVYFFPEGVQKFAAWLPTGIARSQLAGIFTGNFAWDSLGMLLAFSVIFVGIGAGVQIRSAKQGGR